MERSFDLNADVGEGFPDDQALLRVITSANVACGFHAGDAATMRQLCGWAVEYGVVVGAQPSYRDREGFGRRPVEISGAALLADLLEQIEELRAAAEHAGTTIGYLKPHGALYNRAVVDDEHAAAVVEACLHSDLPVLGLPGSRLLALAAEHGVRGFSEFFADRAYDARGRLVSRTTEGATLTDAATVVQRVEQLARTGTVTTIVGARLDVRADSVCVHGDTPGAVELAAGVRRSLAAAGVDVRAFG